MTFLIGVAWKSYDRQVEFPCFSRAAVYIELNELPASTHACAGQSGAMQPRKGQAFPATDVDEKGVRNGKESTDRGN